MINKRQPPQGLIPNNATPRKRRAIIREVGYLNRITLPYDFLEQMNVEPEDHVAFRPIEGGWMVLRHEPKN